MPPPSSEVRGEAHRRHKTSIHSRRYSGSRHRHSGSIRRHLGLIHAAWGRSTPHELDPRYMSSIHATRHRSTSPASSPMPRSASTSPSSSTIDASAASCSSAAFGDRGPLFGDGNEREREIRTVWCSQLRDCCIKIRTTTAALKPTKISHNFHRLNLADKSYFSFLVFLKLT
jgi:hypothetical protein